MCYKYYCNCYALTTTIKVARESVTSILYTIPSVIRDRERMAKSSFPSIDLAGSTPSYQPNALN